MISVLIADDEKSVRRRLSAWIAQEPEVIVTAEASDGLSAVKLTRRMRPDVVIMDSDMPRMSGVDASRIIKAELPSIRIVGFSDGVLLGRAKEFCKAGAECCISKSQPLRCLIDVILQRKD